MLKDIVEPHTWLCCVRDGLDSVFGERKRWGCASFWDELVCVCCIPKSPCPGCSPAGRVAMYPPGVVRRWGVGARASRRAPIPTATASEMQGMCASLPAEGFPGISAPVHPVLKGNSGQPPCRYLVWHREGQKSCPTSFLGRGCTGFAFIPKNRYVSADFFCLTFPCFYS